VFPESSGLIGHSCVLTQNSEDQGGSMITFTAGVLITVILLVGFGFLATASNGWFFKYRKPEDTLPSSDKNN
jgi:hypothetical protein